MASKSLNVLSIAVVSTLALSGLLLAGSEKIAGEVLDETGQPLADVQVTLREAESGQEVTAETSKRGRFTLTVPNSEKALVIHLAKPGYVELEEPFDPDAGAATRRSWTLMSQEAAAQREAEQAEMAEIKGRNLAAKYYNAGAAAYNSGDHDAALEQFRLAVEESPDLALAYGAMVQIYVAKKEFKAAAEAALRFRELEPDEPFGREALYEAYWGLGDREKSDPLLEEMIVKDPGRETAVRVFNVAVHNTREGDLEGALEMFTKALEIDPTLTQAELNVSQMQLNLGRPAEAAASAQHFLAGEPANPQALELLYRAQLRLGDPASAETFRRLSAADPSFATGKYFEEGVELFNAGQPQEAITVFQRVLEAEPDNVRGNYYLGLSYASAGENAQARQYLSRFLELAPDDPEADAARQMIGYLE